MRKSKNTKPHTSDKSDTSSLSKKERDRKRAKLLKLIEVRNEEKYLKDAFTEAWD